LVWPKAVDDVINEGGLRQRYRVGVAFDGNAESELGGTEVRDIPF